MRAPGLNTCPTTARVFVDARGAQRYLGRAVHTSPSSQGVSPMEKLVLAATLISSLAFAAEPAKADAKPADAAAGAPAWKPKKVTKKDTKGIDALYKASQEAWEKMDIAAAEALHDFPIFMLTDNKDGVVSGGQWDKETWNNVMKGAADMMPKDTKFSRKVKPTFVTDTIAFVEETNTMTPKGGKAETYTTSSIVILKDGKWLFKAGAEGGWGDMPMPEKKAEAAPAAQPAGQKPADKQPAAA